MKTLILGTCRVQVPSKKLNDIIMYGGGATASLGQNIQAVEVMNKDIKIPHGAYKPAFNNRTNYKVLEDEVTDFSNINKIVLEVASIYNRYIMMDNKKIYVWKEWCPLCLTEVDDPESMSQKLYSFCSFFPDKEILFIPFPVRHLRADREMLAETLKIFADKNNYDHFDPWEIIKEYGSLKCLKKSRHGICDHYSKFMIKKMRDRISMFINRKNK